MDPREPGKNPSLQTRRHLQGIPKRNKVGRNDLDVSSAQAGGEGQFSPLLPGEGQGVRAQFSLSFRERGRG